MFYHIKKSITKLTPCQINYYKTSRKRLNKVIFGPSDAPKRSLSSLFRNKAQAPFVDLVFAVVVSKQTSRDIFLQNRKKGRY